MTYFFRVGLAGTRFNLFALAFHLDHRPRVGDAHHLMVHHGSIEALRDIESLLREVIHLLGVGRAEAWHGREGSVVSRILLVLRAVAQRIVCHREHEAAIHAHIRNGHEGICSDVQAHMLHRGAGAHTSHGTPIATSKATFSFGAHLQVGHPSSQGSRASRPRACTGILHPRRRLSPRGSGRLPHCSKEAALPYYPSPVSSKTGSLRLVLVVHKPLRAVTVSKERLLDLACRIARHIREDDPARLPVVRDRTC